MLNNSGDLRDRQPLTRVKRVAGIFGSLSTAPAGETSGGSRLIRIAAAAGALFLAIFMALTFAVGGASAADLQCGGIADGGGQGIDCQISVVNNLDLNDPTQTSSTVTMTSCGYAAGPVLAGSCDPTNANFDPTNFTTTTTTSPTLMTDISQCNYSANGSSAVVYCTVDVLNQITGTTTAPLAATVNECNGSAVGGGGDQLRWLG